MTIMGFNLMQSRRLLLQTAVTWGYIKEFQSYAVIQTATYTKGGGRHGTWHFNLMQSCRLRLYDVLRCMYPSEFQSYAVMQTAPAITYNDYILYII